MPNGADSSARTQLAVVMERNGEPNQRSREIHTARIWSRAYTEFSGWRVCGKGPVQTGFAPQAHIVSNEKIHGWRI
jgi:hypothetical protein